MTTQNDMPNEIWASENMQWTSFALPKNYFPKPQVRYIRAALSPGQDVVAMAVDALEKAETLLNDCPDPAFDPDTEYDSENAKIFHAIGRTALEIDKGLKILRAQPQAPSGIHDCPPEFDKVFAENWHEILATDKPESQPGTALDITKLHAAANPEPYLKVVSTGAGRGSAAEMGKADRAFYEAAYAYFVERKGDGLLAAVRTIVDVHVRDWESEENYSVMVGSIPDSWQSEGYEKAWGTLLNFLHRYDQRGVKS